MARISAEAVHEFIADQIAKETTLTAILALHRVNNHVKNLARSKRASGPKPFDREALRLKMSNTDTSAIAAHAVEEFRPAMIHKIWTKIAETDCGLTCRELCEILPGRHQTVSARLNDLMELGYIEDSGKRRLTSRDGKTTAIVWRAVSPGEQLDMLEAAE